MQKNPMLDEDFLEQLSKYPHQFTWAKIISLDFKEYPIEEITGRITAGSINVDGSSAVRRTCSLTLVASDVNINDYYWMLKSKVRIEIGLENHIDSSYPDIIWFNQGIFLLSSFSCSLSVNNYTITLQGKDKMALLNGDFGGVIPSSWDFGTMDETLEDGSIKNTQIPIKDIILQAVHEYAQEPWQNIIVNDLDDYGIELLEYQGKTPFYYLIEYDASGANDSREVAQMVFNPDLLVSVELVDWVNDSPKSLGWTDFDIKISEIEKIAETGKLVAAGALNPPTYSYEKLLEQLDPSGKVTETKNYYRARVKLKGNNTIYTVARIERDNGLQVCGYRICDIVYPYDLIGSPGETITSILDKLVKMLGNFEYFYDVDGHFVFQRKRTYLDVNYNNIIGEHDINREIWVEDKAFNSKYSFVFDENYLISSIQNTPNIGNIKNDYSLWGSRKSGEIEIPIHMRYAIDHKPDFYKTFDGKIYVTKNGKIKYQKIFDEYFNKEKREEKIKEEKISYLESIRRNYPEQMQKKDSLLRDWWKLSDWVTLFEKLMGPIPSEIQMSSDDKGKSSTILDNKNYDILDNLKDVFDIGSLNPMFQISIFDTNQELKIVSIEHGYKSCRHSYKKLLERQNPNGQNRIIWIYDPRIWDKNKIHEDSSSIWTNDTENRLHDLFADKDFEEVDWREIIYQMANDYRRHYRDDDFLITLRDNNYFNGIGYIYPTGYTEYEKYYVDFEMNLSQGVVAYWRELYNPDTINEKNELSIGRYVIQDGGEVAFIKDSSYSFWDKDKDEGYKKGDYVRYKSDKDEINTYLSLANNNKAEPTKDPKRWLKSDGNFIYNSDGWNINILNNPELLNFWFDFLDAGDGDNINKYGVNIIGQRTKAANDTTIKSIYFRETPNVIFDFGDEDIQRKWLKPGYSYIKIPNIYKGIFTLSTRGKNAMDVIEDYLYQYVYPINTISFNSVPIYYLSPNTLIYLNDKKTGAVGEYILQRFSIQLGLNSQMNISAVQTAKRIY